jgi:hypothetical protein
VAKVPKVPPHKFNLVLIYRWRIPAFFSLWNLELSNIISNLFGLTQSAPHQLWTYYVLQDVTDFQRLIII